MLGQHVRVDPLDEATTTRFKSLFDHSVACELPGDAIRHWLASSDVVADELVTFWRRISS